MQVQVSPKHKTLGVPATPEIKNLFPQATVIDFNSQQTALIPHTPTDTFILRKLGYDVPSPILTHYEWPHPPGQPPFDVQKRTSALLTLNMRAYVLNGMGTGKTRAALWAWDYLRGNGLCGKLLVVAPLSTLQFTWAREIFALLPERKCAVLHGSKEQRLAKLKDPSVEIFVINHDGLKVIEVELAKTPEIDALLLDELAVYRNGKAARTKSMRKFAARMKWVWGMSGSPMPNAPTDVWAQAAIITPHAVPKYFNQFRDAIMTKLTEFKYAPKPDAVDRAYAVMQPAVRYALDDVAELPDFVERTVDVEMGTDQGKIYKQMAAACHAMMQGDEITAANAGAALNKLLQISMGWVYGKDKKVIPLDNNKRIEALLDGVNGTDRKVLVFVPYIHALNGIAEALTREGIEHAVVSGDTPAAERNRIFNLFQNTDKYHALVAHPQCLAHGITLTAADTVVWFAPITSLEIYDQANARIRRVGQGHKQLYLHLCSTPVERKIYKMLHAKQQVQSQFLDLFETATESNPQR